ncbi:hypothetical protein UYSO10_3982 [Kosakonia radicincitans]|uniref:FUSC family protein n=1 Tax=Kosakonia radicincitans TaxID=283686 RepID=UPI0011842644|nr:FUSC family protein [Kosakonia radicincitans]VVT52324.1 hypothetical protein UYSO10_3982 [Kosakonia radicincitans]
MVKPALHLPSPQEKAPIALLEPPVEKRINGEERPGEKPALFSLRTTLAALLALTVANALGIDHPWWAAMTVWLVAQPTRGLLLERAFARMVGSAVGAATGAVILLELGGQPIPSLFALALWLMLCAGPGSLFRHFRNYGFVLAGYTAAIVVLFGLGDGIHDGHMARDRVICTMLGIVCSALASIYGVPKGRSEYVAECVDGLMQRCLDRVEQYLRYGSSFPSAQTLIANIAALERSVDNDAAGSLRGRWKASEVRQISGLLLELIALTPEDGNTRNIPAFGSASVEERVTHLSRFCQLLTGSQLSDTQSSVVPLASVLDELSEVLHQPGTGWSQAAFRGFDLRSALRSAARPVIALMLTAAFWRFSGWQAGAMMVMTATLFASLFSAHERGNEALVHVLIGSTIGAPVGTLVHLFLLPQVEDFRGVLICLAPFLALGAWLIRRPSTARMAIDMNMTFLLTAQPGSHYLGVAEALNQLAAIVLGVLAAAATYWLFLPSTPEVHRRKLAQRIAALAEVASQAPTASALIKTHRAQRVALTRLLYFCNPSERMFTLAQECLVKSRLLLVQRTRGTDANSSIVSPTVTAGEALRHASAELNACVAFPSTADRNSL